MSEPQKAHPTGEFVIVVGKTSRNGIVPIVVSIK